MKNFRTWTGCVVLLAVAGCSSEPETLVRGGLILDDLGGRGLVAVALKIATVEFENRSRICLALIKEGNDKSSNTIRQCLSSLLVFSTSISSASLTVSLSDVTRSSAEGVVTRRRLVAREGTNST